MDRGQTLGQGSSKDGGYAPPLFLLPTPRVAPLWLGGISRCAWGSEPVPDAEPRPTPSVKTKRRPRRSKGVTPSSAAAGLALVRSPDSRNRVLSGHRSR